MVLAAWASFQEFRGSGQEDVQGTRYEQHVDGKRPSLKSYTGLTDGRE